MYGNFRSYVDLRFDPNDPRFSTLFGNQETSSELLQTTEQIDEYSQYIQTNISVRSEDQEVYRAIIELHELFLGMWSESAEADFQERLSKYREVEQRYKSELKEVKRKADQILDILRRIWATTSRVNPLSAAIDLGRFEIRRVEIDMRFEACQEQALQAVRRFNNFHEETLEFLEQFDSGSLKD